MTMDGNVDYGALTSAGCDADSCIREMRVYDGKGYYLTIRLSDIPFSTITSVEDADGREKAGLFIPFEGSGVTVTPKRNVLLVCKAEQAQLPSAKYTHLLSQICDRDVVAERRRLGFKDGFVGHMAPIGYRKKGGKQ